MGIFTIIISKRQLPFNPILLRFKEEKLRKGYFDISYKINLETNILVGILVII